MEYFQNALQLSPQTVTYKELGRVYLLSKNLDNAVEIYKKAVKYVSQCTVIIEHLYFKFSIKKYCFDYSLIGVLFKPLFPKSSGNL